MRRTIVYISSCALDKQGTPDSFLLQELPWLRDHFDRVLLCSYYGVAELTESAPVRITVKRPAFASLRAICRTPFSRDFWQELAHLKRDGAASIVNIAKLLLFTMRGYKLHYWMTAMLNDDDDTTLYAFWLSYDGYAAALTKRKNPRMHAIARGHHFDINAEVNPLNPYLMKQMLGDTLDALYPISQDALTHINASMQVPAEKVQVLTLGSPGAIASQRFPAPYHQDGILRIVSCSAIIERKQLPLLIDALALWRGAPIQWTHIGGGPQDQAVREYAAQRLGNKPTITFQFTGNVTREQVESRYASQPFDVFVNTSRSEGVPVSIMEAMRAGIPIVAPAINGIPELVDDAVGRLYAPEGGADAVVVALESITTLTPTQTEALRAAAQARWNERCRNETLLAKMLGAGAPIERGDAHA